jgi:chromosome partitioning protein
MRILAVIQEKGGVAKTTSTFNLGAEFALSGRRVLMADCDTQAGLTSMCIEEKALVGPFLEDALMRPGQPERIGPAEIRKNLHLLPCTHDGMKRAVDHLLLAKVGRELKLRQLLRHYRRDYDLCLLDCPSGLDLMPLSALIAADQAIVPVGVGKAEILCVRTLSDAVREVDAVRDGYGQGPVGFGPLFLTMTRPGTVVARTTRTYAERLFPGRLLATEVRHYLAVKSASAACRTIAEHSPGCPAAEDYRKIAQEIGKWKAKPL